MAFTLQCGRKPFVHRRAVPVKDAAEAVVKRGFSAIKYDPVPGPWRTFIPKDHIRHAVKVMRAVRGHYFLPALGW